MSAPKAPKVPCGTCPYRKDVPSGVWAANEYEKLPQYDGEIIEQLFKGGTTLFMCHQNSGRLCGGWLQTHGTGNLLAIRLQSIDPSAYGYTSKVEVFASGAEACAHGIAEIDGPSPAAKRKVAGLMKKRGDL